MIFSLPENPTVRAWKRWRSAQTSRESKPSTKAVQVPVSEEICRFFRAQNRKGPSGEGRPPRSVKSYLGLISYYGKFLPNLSTTLYPLYKLLRKSALWKWGRAQQSAFEESKKLLIPLTSFWFITTPLMNSLLLVALPLMDFHKANISG